MADKHSFDSYIHNNWSFDSNISSAQSFNSYIRNKHLFSSYPLYAQKTPSDAFWFAAFINRCFMSIQNVLSTSNLALEITIPEILSLIDENLITIRQTIEGVVTIVISAPVITSVVSSLDSLTTDITLPFNISAIISQSNSLTSLISIPTIQITATMNSCQYYMLNYYDADLLSALDSNLLSEMDSVCA